MKEIGDRGIALFPLTAHPSSPVDGEHWFRDDESGLYLQASGVTQRVRSAIQAVTTGSTSIGTGATTITGLSVSCPEAGTYRMDCYIPFTPVGSPTNLTLTLGDGTAPATSRCAYHWWRFSAASSDSSPLTAFNTTDSNALASVISAVMTGVFTATGSGTILVKATRTGGTSETAEAGAYLVIERMD